MQRSKKTQPAAATFGSKVLLARQQQTFFLTELMSAKNLAKKLIKCQEENMLQKRERFSMCKSNKKIIKEKADRFAYMKV